MPSKRGSPRSASARKTFSEQPVSRARSPLTRSRMRFAIEGGGAAHEPVATRDAIADDGRVVAELLDQAHQIRRVVLEIGVEGGDPRAAREIRAREDRGGLTGGAQEPHAVHAGIPARELRDPLRGRVAAAIVDDHELPADPAVERRAHPPVRSSRLSSSSRAGTTIESSGGAEAGESGLVQASLP